MVSDTPKLTHVHRLDSIPLDPTYFTKEGYLVDHPVVTSVGVFEYKNPDGSVRRELRLPEHVFAQESLDSYEGKPVIITHDVGWVTKKNVEGEQVGTILSKGYRDGDDVRAKIIIHNIDEVKASGLRELSLGYGLVLDNTPGEWNGQPYDAVQTEIRINHLALVGDARAGDQARLNIDGETTSLRGGKSMSDKAKKAMDSDELKKTIAAYNARRQQRLDEGEPEGANADNGPMDSPAMGASPAPAPAIMSPEEKLKMVKDRRDRRDQEGNPATPEAAMGVIAQQDEDIGCLLELLEGMQAKSDFDSTAPADAPAASADGDTPNSMGEVEGSAMSKNADSVDAVVRERIKLGRIGDKLNLDGLEDMNPMDAKKAIIQKVNPAMRLDGRSVAYISAAFDVAVDQIAATEKDTNYQRRQASGRMDSSTETPPTGKTSAERARQRMIERMMNGGKE